MSPRKRKAMMISSAASPFGVFEECENIEEALSNAKRCKTPAISKNAARERTRVKSLRNAFHTLQEALPSVPPNTKLSKLDVLVLATTYISHLSRILGQDLEATGTESCDDDALNNQRSLDWSNPSCDATPKKNTSSRETNYLHPVRKWPMRSRLYAGVLGENCTSLTSSHDHPKIAKFIQ